MFGPWDIESVCHVLKVNLIRSLLVSAVKEHTIIKTERSLCMKLEEVNLDGKTRNGVVHVKSEQLSVQAVVKMYLFIR